jgi:prophage maintenance system killer protein
MARKTVHHMDFEVLVGVNERVVALTGEPHGFSPADGRKLAELVKQVEQRADNQEFEEAVADKATLLIYEVARGQFFRAGNKRTALVAGLTFLTKNGHTMDIENQGLVGTVDRAGIAAADLDDLYAEVTRLLAKGKTERRSWDKIIADVIEKNKDFLARLAS